MAVFFFKKQIQFYFDGDRLSGEKRKKEYEDISLEIKPCDSGYKVLTVFKEKWSIKDITKFLTIMNVEILKISKNTFQTRSPSGLRINFTLSKTTVINPDDLKVNATQVRNKN